MNNWYEWIGYLASALVAISLLMSSIKKLRWINMAGAIVFTIYGLLIKSWPVFSMNLFLVLVNIWYLVKLTNRNLTLHLKKEKWDDRLVVKFMCKHKKQIESIYPNFNYKKATNQLFLVYNKFELIGIVCGEKTDGIARIETLFILNNYKDYDFNKKLFEENKLVLKAFNTDSYSFTSNQSVLVKYLRHFKVHL